MGGRKRGRWDNAHEHRDGHFIDEMMVVPVNEGGRARDVLGRTRDDSEWADEELRERLEGLESDDIGSIRNLVDVIRVDDAHETAREVRLRGGVRASPVHELGHFSHARFMTGDGPYDYDVVESVESDEVGSDAPVIAVVDSGVVDEKVLPPWMRSPSVEAESPRDREETTHLYRQTASHGTFVVSLIRQCVPTHAVWLASARAREVPPDPKHHAPTPGVTTELDVVAALARLKRRLRSAQREPVALNLSLGAHSDGPYEDDFLLAVKLALADWRAEFDCPILAAGGNVEAQVDPNPVYPGAFEGVIAVGAVDQCGAEVVWDTDGKTQDGSWRDWIDELDYGVDRIGLSGDPGTPVVRWSGSSFATALATSTSVSP